MVVTLPLVPVFMWLIGRYTEERTREQWTALRLLSTHFLDVVRGLPTLRLLNRSRAQVEALREVGERYRRATMGTLRVTFLSGSVLELAATLGVALVAVTIGVRLVGGDIGLEAGLTVLVLAPELYLPRAAARRSLPRERRGNRGGRPHPRAAGRARRSQSHRRSSPRRRRALPSCASST
jgi:ABC-type transport system involved in cytochrome bd biosynthesis fused ATPase/permease subunit